MPVKFTKPKAAGGLCWVCDKRLYAGDKRLYAGGRSYATAVIDGVERPVHADCKAKAGT